MTRTPLCATGSPAFQTPTRQLRFPDARRSVQAPRGERIRPQAPRSPALGWSLEPAAWLALGLLSAVWAWWGWQKGAYFGTVLLPGLVVLCVGLGLLITFAPWRLRLRLSTPVVDRAVGAGRRSAAGRAVGDLVARARYRDRQRPANPRLRDRVRLGMRSSATCSAAGCSCRSFRWRSPAPFVGADHGRPPALRQRLANGVLEIDGTLEYPLGYRNADGGVLRDLRLPGDQPRARPAHSTRWLRIAGGRDGDALHRPRDPGARAARRCRRCSSPWSSFALALAASGPRAQLARARGARRRSR